MLLRTKRIAFLSLLLAITVILTVLSSYLEMSTFFLLALASYLVGVAMNEINIAFGIGFYLASVILSFFLVPNKLYCLTFAMISAYMVIVEGIRAYLIKIEVKKKRTQDLLVKRIKMQRVFLWGIKYVVFNLLYIPMLIFFPKLIYQGELTSRLYLGLMLGGQLVLAIYDLAYQDFVVKYWLKYRKNLSL